MRTWIALFLLVTVGLSGCAGDATTEEPSADYVDDADNGTNRTVNETVSQETNATIENLVPILNVTADVVNGTAPLLVTFTVDAEDDSETLTWAFAIEGNESQSGSTFPVTFNHTFEAGTWNVSVQVTDGEHVAVQELTIDAFQGIMVLPDVVFEGSALLPDAPWGTVIGGCLMDAGRRDAGGPDGITGTRHNLDPSMWGRSYSFDVAGVVAEYWPGLATGSSGSVPADVDYVVVCINDPTLVDVDYVLTLTG